MTLSSKQNQDLSLKHKDLGDSERNSARCNYNRALLHEDRLNT